MKADKKFNLANKAADTGHLLAIAYFAQGYKPDPKAHPNTLRLADTTFHEIHKQKFFSERLFSVMQIPGSPLEMFGAQTFSESLRLGVLKIFPRYVSLHFIENKEYKAALPLVAIGVLGQEPSARVQLAEIFCIDPSLSLAGFDTSPAGIIKELRKILLKLKMTANSKMKIFSI